MAGAATPPEGELTLTTVDAFLDRMITRERATVLDEARRVADLAARIADAPPTATTTTSGEVTRLSQYVTELLRRTASSRPPSKPHS
ncbi:hypothetical protein ABT234_01565 [Streptomyces sp. NPDC001586]|uniref:hypothetical protein n=2 Tax=unclassified Streptomyces TaxID=2593676 RepID=UPI0033203363